MSEIPLRDYARQTAAYVAENLSATPEEWKVRTSNDFQDGRVFLDGPNEAALLLTFGGHTAAERDRLSVRAFYPNDTRQYLPYELRHAKSHQIGMSREKGPATIALEIQRRLLPDYWPALQVALDARQRGREAAENRAKTVARLGVAFGGCHTEENRVWLTGEGWYGDLRVNHDGSEVSSLELRGITAEQAARIADVLTD